MTNHMTINLPTLPDISRSPIVNNKQCIFTLLAVVHWEYTDYHVLVDGAYSELHDATAG